MGVRYKRGQVINCDWPKSENKDGTPNMEPRPMVVLRDTSENPDVVMLTYCTTQNKDLLYKQHIFIDKNTEEFFNMGLDDPTYIIPQITKPMPYKAIKGKRGFCSKETMDKIDKIIENWTLGK